MILNLSRCLSLGSFKTDFEQAAGEKSKINFIFFPTKLLNQHIHAIITILFANIAVITKLCSVFHRLLWKSSKRTIEIKRSKIKVFFSVKI